MANSEKKQTLPQTVNHLETNTNYMAVWQADALLNIFSDLGARIVPSALPGAVWPEEAGITPLALCHFDYSVVFWGLPSSRELFWNWRGQLET